MLLSYFPIHLSAQQAVVVNPKWRTSNSILTPEWEEEPVPGGPLENGFFSLGFDTEIGAQYRLTYVMGTKGGPEAGVRAEIFSSTDLSLGHSETFLTSDSKAWASPTGFDFTATTSSTTLELLDITPGGPTGSALILDYALVTTIPEPGVSALLGLGLATLCFFRRRLA